MSAGSWGDIAAVATAVGLPIGLVSLLYVAKNLVLFRRTAAADFLLRSQQEFVRSYGPTYAKFRPGGEWSGNVGPSGEDEVVEVQHYLDFFATLNILVKQRLVSLQTIDEMFAYRFFVVAHNKQALGVVERDPQYWQALIGLYEMWYRHRQARNLAMPDPELAARWIRLGAHVVVRQTPPAATTGSVGSVGATLAT